MAELTPDMLRVGPHPRRPRPRTSERRRRSTSHARSHHFDPNVSSAQGRRHRSCPGHRASGLLAGRQRPSEPDGQIRRPHGRRRGGWRHGRSPHQQRPDARRRDLRGHSGRPWREARSATGAGSSTSTWPSSSRTSRSAASRTSRTHRCSGLGSTCARCSSRSLTRSCRPRPASSASARPSWRVRMRASTNTPSS